MQLAIKNHTCFLPTQWRDATLYRLCLASERRRRQIFWTNTPMTILSMYSPMKRAAKNKLPAWEKSSYWSSMEHQSLSTSLTNRDTFPTISLYDDHHWLLRSNSNPSPNVTRRILPFTANVSTSAAVDRQHARCYEMGLVSARCHSEAGGDRSTSIPRYTAQNGCVWLWCRER